jgi:hypothetical protein
MQGQELYRLLFESLDLPDSIKGPYLESIMKKYSVCPEEVSLDILREIVADLLQDLILQSEDTQPVSRAN